MKSSIYTVLCTTIRLGALWLGITVLLRFPGTYAAATNADFGKHTATPLLVWSAIVIVIAFLLWLYPGLLARPAAARSSRQVFESPVSPEQMQHAALVVLGMWFVMTGVIDLASKILAVTYIHQMDIVGNESARLSVKVLSRPVIQIVAGCILTLGSRGLAGMLHRMRESSLASTAHDDSPAIEENEKS